MKLEDARQRVEWAAKVFGERIPREVMAGAKVLDIGCGTGNGVIAALKLGAHSAVGIDRDAAEFGEETHFAQLVEENGVDRRSATLIQGDVFNMGFFDGGFDVAVMYDSIEHVPDPRAFVQFMARSLRPGGHGLILTCPLYYSPVGHHLWHVFPEAAAPWAHLYRDFPERLKAANIGSWHEQRFGELNKVTRGQLLAYIKDAGLELVADNSVMPERLGPLFEQFGHLIDMEMVPEREDLFYDFTSLLFRKSLVG